MARQRQMLREEYLHQVEQTQAESKATEIEIGRLKTQLHDTQENNR